jgi:RNA polymerase sigma-70 factor (ECF subfamily)
VETYKTLLIRLKAGEENAWRTLYDQYYNMLCIVAYQYVKDRFLAETFVGNVFYHLWEQRESIQIHTSLKEYLIKAVKNQCINYINHMKVRMLSEPLLREDYNKQRAYDEAFGHPLAQLITSELEDSLNKAIAALPLECREVFRLSRREELNYEEIAERLHISVNTVKYHIKNALTQLRTQFKKYLTILCYLLVLDSYPIYDSHFAFFKALTTLFQASSVLNT